MGSPDHIGSTVPVMVTFLLLDRAPQRWYTAIAAGLILSVGLVADGIVLYTGIMPVLAICAVRIYRSRFQLKKRWRASSFELILAAATGPAIWLARTALTMIARHGGFRVWPVSPLLASPGDLGRSLAVTGRGLLLLFGADFFGHPAGFVAALAFAHLIGLGLAAWATCATIRRLSRADLGAALLAAGIVLTLTAYLLSTRADDLASTRDITAVLPFGAALAGRALAGRLVSARLVPALALVLIGYLFSLGRLVTAPPAPPESARLGSWLAAHHLHLRTGRLLECQRHDPGYRGTGQPAVGAGQRHADNQRLLGGQVRLVRPRGELREFHRARPESAGIQALSDGSFGPPLVRSAIADLLRE